MERKCLGFPCPRKRIGLRLSQPQRSQTVCVKKARLLLAVSKIINLIDETISWTPRTVHLGGRSRRVFIYMVPIELKFQRLSAFGFLTGLLNGSKSFDLIDFFGFFLQFRMTIRRFNCLPGRGTTAGSRRLREKPSATT